jgi:hypothetical protein
MSSNQAATLTVAVPSQSTQPLTTQQPDGEFYSQACTSLDSVKQLGDWIAHSGMFGATKPEQGYVLALECIASKQTPLSWKKSNHLINGNITMKSESMLAGLMDAGWDIDWIQFDASAAIADFSKGAKKVRVSFTADDAKQAGLIPAKPGSGWAKFPAEMLRARLISKATRMLDPRITQGRYSPEEIADISNTSPTPAQAAPTRQTVNVTPESTFSLVEKLEQILEPHSEAANAFLLSKNLIKPDQNFRDVSTKVANMIIADADGFISKAKAFANPVTE